MKRLLMALMMMPLLALAGQLTVTLNANGGSGMWPTSYRTNFSKTDVWDYYDDRGDWQSPVLMDPGGAAGSQRLYVVRDEYDENGQSMVPDCPYSRQGYEFAGWAYYDACRLGESFEYMGTHIGGYDGIVQPGEKIVLCGVSALVATWRVNSYTVTFNANGGSCSTSSKQYSSGSTLGTLPTATRSGYTFDGWYTSSSGGTKVSSSTAVTGNVTYYAHWSVSGSGVALTTALNVSGISFSNGGNASWFGQTAVSHDGSSAARSGQIGANQSSAMQTTVTGPADISFWWKVSSENASYDYLEFLIDNEQKDKIGGTGGSWAQKTYSIGSGSHTLKWNYCKDGSYDSGDDCGWVDQLVVMSKATPSDPLAQSGLVVWYKFDGNLNDASGNGYGMSGTCGGYVAGREAVGQAMSFAGNTSVCPAKGIEIEASFTISCWLRADEDIAVVSESSSGIRTNGKMVLLPGQCKTYGSMQGAGIGFAYGKNGVAVYEHGGNYLPGVLMYNGNIGTGWNFVTITVSNDNAPLLYINGEFVRQGVKGARAHRCVMLGKDYATIGGEFYGNRFKGCADDFRIYNRALSAAEVKALYGGGEAPVATQFTVTFNANGGSCSTSSKQYSSGSTLGTLPTATRSGYAFDGWYTSSGGGTKVTSSTTVTGNVTYYAHWVQNVTYYTVTFNANGGSCSTSSKQFSSGSTLGTLPTATRSGYTFDGWYTSSSGGTKVTSSTTVTKAVTYYAHWTKVVTYCEVAFDVNGGEGGTTWREVETGKSIGTLPTPVRSKHKFLGWYTQRDGGTKISTSTKVKTDVTYYAHWQYDGSVYVRTSISEECEGMGTVSGGNKSVKGGSSATLKAKAKKGFVFCQWVPIGMSEEQEDEFYETHDVYKPTLKMPVGSSDMSFEAYFIPVADDGMYLWGYEEWNNEAGVPLRTADSLWDYERYIEIEGGSLPKFSMSGLPPGVKYTVRNWCIGFTGKPTKEGTYWVICTAKNASGYQATGIIKWVIGNPKPTDYDNIRLNMQANAWRQMCGLQVGREIEDSLSLDEWVCEHCGDEITKWAISGLPTGLKLRQNCHGRYVITGMPTKAGKFTLKITATYADKHTAKAVQTIVVEGGECGSAYVKVAVAPGQEYMGTASGGGVCVRASKAKLTAKAKKGYVFAGWYDGDGNRWRNTNSGDWRKASDSYVVRVDEWPEFYARFVPKSSDQSVSIRCPSEWNVECTDVGNLLYDVCSFDVDSASLPTVTVSGLPSGCKFDKVNMRLVFEKQPKKPGISKVTIKAENVSKAKDEKILYVKVPNLRSDVFDGIDYDRDYRVPQYDSMACRDSWASFSVRSGWTVTASGLPSGLTLKKYDGGTFLQVVGTAKKAGAYTVTLTAKRGGVSEKATFTMIVDPLPSYAIGTFNGVLSGECYDCSDSRGTFTMTSTSSGKLSATLITEFGDKYTFSANSWNCFSDEKCYAYFRKKGKSNCGDGEQYISVFVGKDSAWNDYQLTGDFFVDGCRVGGEGKILAQRNPFGKIGKNYENREAHSIAAALAEFGKMGAFVVDSRYGEYGILCLNCVERPYGAKPDLTFTVALDGTVKVAGKIGGKSVSGSSKLRIIGDELQADFMFSASKTPISIHVEFVFGYGANGAVFGSARVGR